MARYVVAAVGDIPPGQRRIVEIGGRSIGIFNLDGQFYALRNRCPHQGGPLCEGPLWGRLTAEAPGAIQYEPGGVVSCGWHGWEYDIRTGQSWCEPSKLRVKAYDVSLTPGAEIGPDELETDPSAPIPGRVRGPYVVETFPVSVEDRYVVVDVPA